MPGAIFQTLVPSFNIVIYTKALSRDASRDQENSFANPLPSGSKSSVECRVGRFLHRHY